MSTLYIVYCIFVYPNESVFVLEFWCLVGARGLPLPSAHKNIVRFHSEPNNDYDKDYYYDLDDHVDNK